MCLTVLNIDHAPDLGLLHYHRKRGVILWTVKAMRLILFKEETVDGLGQNKNDEKEDSLFHDLVASLNWGHIIRIKMIKGIIC